ncbi:MAG TPA: phosphoglycerate kinase [Phycisphaerae bacterium]|nr:phosphoglycerate kinase [Phycisphaerae bacterium]
MATKTIADVDVKGKRVLMRVDFNVPLKDGKITNDRRIVMALPTIRKVVEEGGKLILMSHLGRPEGKFDPADALTPCAKRLGELLGKPVRLGPEEVVGPQTEKMVAAMAAGDVLLLENVRFQPGETVPDKAKKNPRGKLTRGQQRTLDEFAEALGKLGDVYVNDAFGTCHRKHASMVGAAKVIQKAGGPAVAGFLVEKEIRYLHDAVADPQRPFLAILGGVKVSDKIKLISSLLEKVDRILIGGAMAYTLLKAKGAAVGKSLVETNKVAEMRSLLERAGDKIALPCDHVAAETFESDQATPVAGVDIPDNLMGMDIGPNTIRQFAEAIATARTIVWNGPMGVFEREAYAAGTRGIAEAVAAATDAGAVSVIGGGDTATAVEQMGLDNRMTHVSTGGGASLTYLEGKPMPAIEILDEK